MQHKQSPNSEMRRPDRLCSQQTNKQRAKQQTCRSTAYCPVDSAARRGSSQLRSQQVLVTLRTCCNSRAKMIKRTSFTVFYSSFLPHMNSMKTAIAKAKQGPLIPWPQCAGRRHGLASGEVFFWFVTISTAGLMLQSSSKSLAVVRLKKTSRRYSRGIRTGSH